GGPLGGAPHAAVWHVQVSADQGAGGGVGGGAPRCHARVPGSVCHGGHGRCAVSGSDARDDPRRSRDRSRGEICGFWTGRENLLTRQRRPGPVVWTRGGGREKTTRTTARR